MRRRLPAVARRRPGQGRRRSTRPSSRQEWVGGPSSRVRPHRRLRRGRSPSASTSWTPRSRSCPSGASTGPACGTWPAPPGSTWPPSTTTSPPSGTCSSRSLEEHGFISDLTAAPSVDRHPRPGGRTGRAARRHARLDARGGGLHPPHAGRGHAGRRDGPHGRASSSSAPPRSPWSGGWPRASRRSANGPVRRPWPGCSGPSSWGCSSSTWPGSWTTTATWRPPSDGGPRRRRRSCARGSDRRRVGRPRRLRRPARPGRLCEHDRHVSIRSRSPRPPFGPGTSSGPTPRDPSQQLWDPAKQAMDPEAAPPPPGRAGARPRGPDPRRPGAALRREAGQGRRRVGRRRRRRRRPLADPPHGQAGPAGLRGRPARRGAATASPIPGRRCAWGPRRGPPASPPSPSGPARTCGWSTSRGPATGGAWATARG